MKNSKLKTQAKKLKNSSKKLKVSAKFLKLLEILTQFKCKIHFNVRIMAKIPNFKLKYCKNSPFIRGNWMLFKIIQAKKLNNSRKKLKTQDKNSRFRQSQKRGLPKTRPKKAWPTSLSKLEMKCIFSQRNSYYYT